MIYVIAAMSALVTGSLFALAFRVMLGVDHPGILVAVAVIGGGLQTAVLIAWYLRHTAHALERSDERTDPSLGA